MSEQTNGTIIEPQNPQPEPSREANIPADHSMKTEAPKETFASQITKNAELNQVEPAESQATPWQFKTEEDALNVNSDKVTNASKVLDKPITWTASEFIHHTKTIGWYMILALVTVLLAAAVFFLTHDKISTSVIILAAIVLGIYANRKPRTLEYRLDSSGIGIGQKSYAYGSFKSFSVMDEGAFSSIILLPLKRFSPLVSLYFDPTDEHKIMSALADRLPLDDRRQDVVDHLMRRIRF